MKRLDHTEEEDGQACVRACVCIYLVWYGPTEGFKDWKNLKRLDHIEGEDGQACAFFACVFPVWSDLVWS